MANLKMCLKTERILSPRVVSHVNRTYSRTTTIRCIEEAVEVLFGRLSFVHKKWRKIMRVSTIAFIYLVVHEKNGRKLRG